MTPLHWAAEGGYTDVTKVLVEAGASLSAVDNEVIKPSVKLRQSNIKLFK
jgi:ankyrin repeat protein